MGPKCRYTQWPLGGDMPKQQPEAADVKKIKLKEAFVGINLKAVTVA